MKKLFTLLVAAMATMCASAQTLYTYADASLTKANADEGTFSTLTFTDGSNLQLVGNIEKEYSAGANISYENTKAKSIKLSNGAQNKYTAPEGKAVSKVKFISYVNKAYDKTPRTSFWKEVNGVNYTAETATIMNCFYQKVNKVESYLDADGKETSVDEISFDFDKAATSFTFANGGEQACFFMEITLVEAPATETLSITAAGYATCIAQNDLDFTDSDVKAYAVSLSAEGTITLTQTDVATAGDALLIEGAEGDHNVAIKANEKDILNTDLKAATAAVTCDGTQYILANGSNGVGFYKGQSGTAIPAGKCYLVYAANSAKDFIGLGDATAIQTIEAAAESNVLYNLAGQRVSENYKGVVIKNGKKVLNK